VGITSWDAALAEFGQHGGGIDSQVLADSGERPPEVVQMNGVIDLYGGQAPAAHRHAVTVQDLADRSSFDTEPGTQLIHRLSTLISGDEFPNLIGVELARPAGFGSIDGRWSGYGGVRQLPTQGFQGFYLRFGVAVRSPKVHRKRRSGPALDRA
jgi:hypothetical protein